MLNMLSSSWFHPWGWTALVVIAIFLVTALIIVFILKSGNKQAGEEKKSRKEKPAAESKPEPQPEPKPAVEPKPAPTQPKPASQPNVKQAAAQRNQAASDKTYHISKRKEDNKWQVKAEGSEKALKLFDTQAEAITYAKKVAGNQEARLVVHKVDGSFRKS